VSRREGSAHHSQLARSGDESVLVCHELSGVVSPHTVSMTFRVAVIGLGEAGYSLHLPALAGIRDVAVVGGVDISAERRARAHDKYRVPVFADFQQMVAEARPDVVIVGTPPDSHADYCVRSLDAGAHVICEKPFVSSVDEAGRVLEAAARARRQIAVNHEFREMPIFRALRNEVDRDRGEDVVFAQVWQLMDMPPWAESGWRGQMLHRILFEAGVHLVDFLMALFNEKPVAVSATMSACGMNEADTDAVSLVALEFSRGRLAHIVQNRLCKGEMQYFEVRAETPKRSLRASFGGRARVSAGLHRGTRPHVRVDYGVSGIAWSEHGNTRTFLARNPKNPNMMATRNVIERSLIAFRDGVEPPTSGERARDVLEVIAACYRAASSGARVALSDAHALGLADLRMGVASKA
jgi:predicted dehydrogenase